MWILSHFRCLHVVSGNNKLSHIIVTLKIKFNNDIETIQMCLRVNHVFVRKSNRKIYVNVAYFLFLTSNSLCM